VADNINMDFKEIGWGECGLDSVGWEHSKETSGSLRVLIRYWPLKAHIV